MIAVLLACGPAPVDSSPSDSASEWTLEALQAPGPFPVGYRVDEVTWDLPDGSPRTLRLAVWYPAAEAQGEPVEYLYGLHPDPDSFGDAVPADGSFPVVAMSHGHQGYAEVSSFLLTHLASHGHVVVSPDHTGNTTFDGSDRDTAIYWQRPMDLSAVLDHMEGWGPDDPAADMTAPVLLGHSFGGYTVFAAMGAAYDAARMDGCAADVGEPGFCHDFDADDRALFEAGLGDPRWARGVAMAAGDETLFADGVTEVTGPVHLMTGGLDGDHQGQAYWPWLTGTGSDWVDLPRGGHQTFTDVAGGFDVQPGQIDAKEGWDLINAWVLAWVLTGRGETGLDWVWKDAWGEPEAVLTQDSG